MRTGDRERAGSAWSIQGSHHELGKGTPGDQHQLHDVRFFKEAIRYLMTRDPLRVDNWITKVTTNFGEVRSYSTGYRICTRGKDATCLIRDTDRNLSKGDQRW